MIGPGSDKEIIMNSLQDPETNGLKRLLAVKKSLSEFEQRVEHVRKVNRNWNLRAGYFLSLNWTIQYALCRWSKSIHIKVSAVCLMSQVVQHLLVESKDLMDLYLTRYHWFNLTSWLPNCGYCSNKCFCMRLESHIKYNFAPPIWYTLVTGMDCPTQLVLSDPSPIIALPCYSLSQ